jgi:signal transduction histidine kinase
MPGPLIETIAAVSAVLIAVFVALVIRSRRRNSAREQEELAALVAERTQELAQQKARAEDANRIKSQFLANISHEIRSPMSGILGTLELALMTELTREQREYLELSKTSAESLLALLDDLFDFSKLEAERIDIDHIEFSLQHCLRGATSTVAARAEEKKIQLRIHIAPDVPDRLMGDPDRLRQVLLKILDNAVKFSSGGDVLINVARESQPGTPPDNSHGSLHLLFTLEDNGPGVPREKRNLIFEPMRQLDGSTTRKYGGSGLGLAMCGKLVRLMDGRIWLDSNVKAGSRFCFTVRVGVPENNAPSKPPAAGPARKERVTGLRVLVAEDNRVNQVVTSRLLEKHGFQTLAAYSGRAALELLQWERVDLVLMDVQMPEIDGLEATRRIREMEKKTGAHLPILAMTAGALQGDRDKCLSAGMDGYLTKPVQSNQLFQAIDSLLAS